ncbi:hypothetical protein [Paenibacillus puerhi]|uniref:hypothetical protein n=1 Tax=Paenibacillus puerhi TaxID=2692622 RepID=UPI00135AE3DA|nr:hypothetical protein [Paenibacillus puerhi]
MTTGNRKLVELDIYVLIEQLGLDAERWRSLSSNDIVRDKPEDEIKVDSCGDAT